MVFELANPKTALVSIFKLVGIFNKACLATIEINKDMVKLASLNLR